MNYDRIADYYDRYVKYDGDIPFFIKEAAKTSGEILELMSGTGRLSLPLIEAGARLTCVDSSQPMLDILRNKLKKRKLPASVIQQNISELALHRQFDLIIIPFHSFAELASPEDRLSALGKIREHLSANGRFICTLHNANVRIKTITKQLHLISRDISGNSMLLVWSAENYNPQSRLVEGVQLYEEYDGEGLMTSRIAMSLKFCLLGKTQFEDMAAASGFRISRLYGDYSYSEFKEESSPVMVFELRK